MLNHHFLNLGRHLGYREQLHRVIYKVEWILQATLWFRKLTRDNLLGILGEETKATDQSRNGNSGRMTSICSNAIHDMVLT